MGIVSGVLVAGAAVVGVSTLFLLVECSLGLASRRTRKRVHFVASAHLPTVVVVPAHNEESIVEATVRHLVEQLSPKDSVFVVADNCTDNTAAAARAGGAMVAERTDPTRRGKGYALSFAMSCLQQHDPPATVVVMDADCRITSGGLQILADSALALGRPVQADYVMNLPDAASPKARLSALAFRIRNRVRTRGLQRLGGAVHLAGTGMAFPWDILVKAPSMDGHVTEDLALGLELSLRGLGAELCAEITVDSELAPSDSSQSAQRRRWESGYFQSMIHYWPLLVRAALQRRDFKLILAALDLSIPPLALQATLVAAGCAAGAVSAALFQSPLPLVLFVSQATAILGTVGIVWTREGRDLVRPRDVLSIPAYVAQKIPSYLRMAISREKLEWNKTERA